MSDQGVVGSNSGEQSATGSNLLSDKRIAVGTGAVLGGLSTLAATLSMKELLQDNPFVALAVFALLGAFLIFIFALTCPRVQLWPVTSFAIALLFAGVAAGRAAMVKGPTSVNLVVRAMPTINDAKPIKLGQYEVGWGSDTHMRAGGELTLDLTGVETYYNAKEQAARGQCLDVLRVLAPELNIGPGLPKTATQAQRS
jgi:hypothetical protein